MDIDPQILAWISVALCAATLLFVLAVVVRQGRQAGLADAVADLASGQERLGRTIGEDLARARAENGEGGRHLREEVGTSLAGLSANILSQMGVLARGQHEQFAQFAEHLRRSGAESREQGQRDHEALVAAVRELRDQTAAQLAAMRTDQAGASRQLSETIAANLKSFEEATVAQSRRMLEIQARQHESFEARLGTLSEAQGRASEALRATLDGQLKTLREDNASRLEAMRATVDEKLQGTLEQRLGESFKQVSERLEAVHKGLGEMQNLATGVGDLKRVLTNVKARGSWGEVQLGALLEQILTQGQYVQNAVMAESGAERVEFAIRMPGNGQEDECFLPIDAKFPIEDYERLQHAAEAGDIEAVEAAGKALEARLRKSAQDISGKYVRPPRTTDFAIMFLPTEGLYAEAIRRPGLADDLQRVHRVVIAGPTTLTAILSSLQMGFRTLAIQERSSEVWQVLGAVKTEFGKFGDVLGSVKKKLQEASNHIEKAEVRNRAINRKLRDVQHLPAADAAALLGSAEEPGEDGRLLIGSDFFDAPEDVR